MGDGPVPLRSLGELSAPAIGFGAMVLSPGLYGPVDEDEAALALLHAIDRGATFIDTSDGYGPDGHNERLVGDVIHAADRRDEVVIATKFGYRVPAGVERHPFDVSYGTLAVNAEPQHVRGYALASLERLRTERIDLYYPHFPDPTVPIEETVGAMADLVAEGLVGHLGLSNVSVDQLRRALQVHRIAAVQVEWSLWTRPDDDLLALAAEHGVGIVAWSPLGGGFLAGGLTVLAPDDFRNNFPRLAGANLASNNERFAPLAALAAELGITPSQLALAWLLHRDQPVVAIPGSRTPAHISENIAAAQIRLDGPTLERIERVLQAFDPVGGGMLEPPAEPRR